MARLTSGWGVLQTDGGLKPLIPITAPSRGGIRRAQASLLVALPASGVAVTFCGGCPSVSTTMALGVSGASLHRLASLTYTATASHPAGRGPDSEHQAMLGRTEMLYKADELGTAARAGRIASEGTPGGQRGGASRRTTPHPGLTRCGCHSAVSRSASASSVTMETFFWPPITKK